MALALAQTESISLHRRDAQHINHEAIPFMHVWMDM